MRGPGGGTRGSGGPQGGTLPTQQPFVPPTTGTGTAVTPTPVGPTSGLPGVFGGSSSYNPEQWAQWEDQLFGALPQQPQGGQNDYVNNEDFFSQPNFEDQYY